MENSFNPNNDWRKVALAIYRKPVDSKIFGSIELDVTDLEAFVQKKRREGLKITLMHPLILFIARGLATEVPELNCYVRRGRLLQRPQVDAMVSVLLPGGNQLGQARVRNAGRLTLSELAGALRHDVADARKGQEIKTMQMKSVLASLPWPLRGWVLRFFKWLVIDLGVAIPALGMAPDSFGSFVFSNIGSIGIDVGYAALMPVSNVSMVVTMGGVQSKPAVVDGQIVPRRLLTLSAVIDHRIADATHAGQMFRYLKGAIRKPEVLL